LSVYVVNEVNYPVPGVLNLPLQVRGVSKDLVVVSSIPPSVALKVRGPYRLIRRLEATGPPASLDLRRYVQPGDYDIRVEVPDLGRVLVTGQQYETYRVTLDRRAALKKRLQIDQRNDLGDRLIVGEEVVEPVEVVITGPTELVDRVALARIEPDLARLGKRIGGKLEAVAEVLPVKLYDPDGHELTEQLLKINPQSATYTLTPVPVGSIKVLKVVPEYIGEPAQGYYVSALSSSLLYVPLEAELVPEGIVSIKTSPVDISGRSTTFSVNARLDYGFKLPAGNDLPQSCEVTVEIISRKALSEGLYEVQIRIEGQRSGNAYELDPPAIELSLDGGAALSAQQAEALRASINVEDLGPGEYWLMPQLSLPAGVKGARILPSSVRLTVSADAGRD
jgi:YbbR domain-containing protein